METLTSQRNSFNHRYVLYRLLKQRGYPVTIEDFPEVASKDPRDPKKLCDDYMSAKDNLTSDNVSYEIQEKRVPFTDNCR